MQGKDRRQGHQGGRKTRSHQTRMDVATRVLILDCWWKHAIGWPIRLYAGDEDGGRASRPSCAGYLGYLF